MGEAMPRLGAIQRKTWCPRCQEELAAPDAKQPLEDPRYEAFSRNIAIRKLGTIDAWLETGAKCTRASARTTAKRIRHTVAVMNRIHYLMELEIERDLRTREWVDDKLKETVLRCMQKTPVLDKKGKHIGEWKFDSRGTTTALHLMGKDRGMFVEKVEITGIDAELKDKTPKQISAMVEAAAIDLGRDFIKQLAEKIGLLPKDGKDPAGAKASSGKSVPSLH